MKNHLCNASGKRQSSHSTYYDAVIEGQRTLGFGNFEVQTPGRVPTRDEQLLRKPTTTESRRKNILESL
jgi:hypothetical protein